MSVRRIMTDLPSRAPAESQEFCRCVLGWEPVIGLGLISHDECAPVLPAVSIEVDHMDAAYAAVRPRPPTGTGTSSTC